MSSPTIASARAGTATLKRAEPLGASSGATRAGTTTRPCWSVRASPPPAVAASVRRSSPTATGRDESRRGRGELDRAAPDGVVTGPCASAHGMGRPRKALSAEARGTCAPCMLRGAPSCAARVGDVRRQSAPDVFGASADCTVGSTPPASVVPVGMTAACCSGSAGRVWCGSLVSGMHERNEAPYMAASCMLHSPAPGTAGAWIVGRAPKRRCPGPSGLQGESGADRS